VKTETAIERPLDEIVVPSSIFDCDVVFLCHHGQDFRSTGFGGCRVCNYLPKTIAEAQAHILYHQSRGERP